MKWEHCLCCGRIRIGAFPKLGVPIWGPYNRTMAVWEAWGLMARIVEKEMNQKGK